MSWKTTNNRNNTTATDVIRCDELIAEVIIAENATLNKKITVNRNITLRDLSITDISMTTIIAVPDVSVNRIGENTVGGMIEFISPFSAPAAEITSIFANDSSISQLSTHDLSVDIIKSTGNNIHFHNADVSFNGSVEAHDACFNELFTLDAQEFHFISDISTNDAIYVSDISVDILRGPIKIEFDDISLHNVQHASDVSLANNLDISLLEVMNIGLLSASHLTIYSDVSFRDISALDLSVDVITIGSIVGDVSVNGDLSINGGIKAGVLKGPGEIIVTEDASFEKLHGNDVSVNNIYGTYVSSDTSLVIYGDISINNANELRIPTDPKDINQLKKKPLSAKKELANDTFGMITVDDVYNSLIFRNNIGNFSTVEMDDLNVKSLSMSLLTLTDGSSNNGYFFTTDVSSHTLSDDLSGFSGGFVIGDHGYLVPDSSSVMVRFGLSNEDNVATDISLIDFGDLSGSSGGFSSGKYGYLVPDASTTLVRYDANNDDISKIKLAGDLSGFRGGFASDGSGYLVPFLGNKVVSFPLTDNKFTYEYVQDFSLTDNFANTDLSGFYGGFSIDNNIFLAPNSHSKLVKIKEDEFVNKELSVNVLDVPTVANDGDLKGFVGGFAAGAYGYLVPYDNGGGRFGKVVRFDLATFTNVAVLDVANTVITNTGQTDSDLKGFFGGFAAGAYGYLVPYHNGARFGKVVRFPTTLDFSSIDLSVTKSDPELIGFKGGFAHDNSGYLVPSKNGKVVQFSTSDFSANNVTVIDFPYLTGDASLVEFSGGFKDGTHGYLIPETYNKVARFDLSTARIIESLDISVNGKDVSGFSGGFISGDYGYLIPNKSNELVRFSTNQDNTIINSDDKFRLDTFKSNDTITIDKNRAYNLRIDFSYLMALDPESNPYEDVSMMVEIKPYSDISYFYNYDNSGSAGPRASEDISNVVRITDLSYSEAFNFTFARKSDSDISMLITLRDNCNNDTTGNALSRLINFDVCDNNVADVGNFDATYDVALRDRNGLSFINDNTSYMSVNQRTIIYNYLLSNGIKLFDKVLIEQWLLKPPPLYDFVEHTFTNANVVGATGPTLTQMRNEYSPTWTDNDEFFNSTGDGIQIWTVPADGTYKIEVFGGSGGNPGNYWGEPGKGAKVEGKIILTQGSKLYISIGHEGYQSGSFTAFGGGGKGDELSSLSSQAMGDGVTGGGMSFVARTASAFDHEDNNADILFVAGGGGGPAGTNNVIYDYFAADGGDGGYLTGGDGSDSFNSDRPGGKGGTQNKGGDGGESSKYPTHTPGAPGEWATGGNSSNTTNNSIQGGGGGGGYYGGGGGGDGGGGGGGGSSFISSSLTITDPTGGTRTDLGHGKVYIKLL